MQPIIQTATPSQLLPNRGKESNYNDASWNMISVSNPIVPSTSSSGNDVVIDLPMIGSILSLLGSSVSFNVEVVGTGVTTAHVQYHAPMMFQQVRFDTGDSTPVDIKRPDMAYLLKRSKHSYDYSFSSERKYSAELADEFTPEGTGAEASPLLLPVTLPLSVFCGFFDIDNYYHKNQSRITLTVSDIERAISVSEGTIVSARLADLRFTCKQVALSPELKRNTIQSWEIAGNTFNFDSFKISPHAIVGENSYNVVNDRRALQLFAILAEQVNGTTIDYSNPVPITLKPVNVNLDVNGTPQVQKAITNNLTHMAVVSEALNLDDELRGCNPLLIQGILNSATNGSVFAWQTGMEIGENADVRTGLNTPVKNSFVTVDMNILTSTGADVTSGNVYNILCTQEMFTQNAYGSAWIK